jgi:hypothetical protein
MMRDSFLMIKDLVKLYFRVLFNRLAFDGGREKEEALGVQRDA